jgi:transcriptional regulator with AAA-type ATPase domain
MLAILFGKEKPVDAKDSPSEANKAWNFTAQIDAESLRKEVYLPEIDPELVVESAEYESRLDFGTPQSIVRTGIEEYSFLQDNKASSRRCGVIYRRYAVKLKDVVKKPDPIALLQEAAQIILRMESCLQRAIQENRELLAFSHGCITPKLLFLDQGTGLLSLIGMNIKKLAMLIGEQQWNGLCRADAYTLAFRTPEKLEVSFDKLDLLDDIYSLCLSLLCECDPKARQKPFGIDWSMFTSRKDAMAAMKKVDRTAWIDATIQNVRKTALKKDADSRKLEEFQRIIGKALHCNPQNRYQEVGSFVNDCFRCAEPLSMDKVLSDLQRLNIPEKYLGEMMLLKSWILDGNSPAAIPIFITGPSGCGKTYMAKKIHEFIYDGSDLNFVRIDGAELSKNLAISTLFGHKKGSFTGADHDRVGRVELARNGTVLLDEIQDLEPEIQGTLMKTLDPPHEFTPLGSTEANKKYARCLFVFCTNRNIAEMLSAGTIRQDFVNRISNIRIDMPPVQEKKEIFRNYILSHFEEYRTIIAHHLDESLALKLLKGTIEPDALDLLVNAPNAGNFRSGDNYARQSVVTILNKIQREKSLAGNAAAPNFTIDDARKIIDQSVIPQKPMVYDEHKERPKPPDAIVVLQKIVQVLRKNCRENHTETVRDLSIDYVIAAATDLLKNEYRSISRSWVANNVLKTIIRDQIISGKLSADAIKKEYGPDSFDCELLINWGRDRKKR